MADPVVVAGVVAVIILAIGWMAASEVKINRHLISGLAVTLGVVILGGGIWATVDGEREFHEHEPHGAESHGDDHDDDGHGDDGHDDDGDSHENEESDGEHDGEAEE